jgi:hypothetical protein
LKFIPSKAEWTASPICACLYKLFPPIMCFCFGTPLLSFNLFFGPFYKNWSASSRYASYWFLFLCPPNYSLWFLIKFYGVFWEGSCLASDIFNDFSPNGWPNYWGLISKRELTCFYSCLCDYSYRGRAIYYRFRTPWSFFTFFLNILL